MLFVIVALYKTAGHLFEAIAVATELDEHTAMHESIEDGGGQYGVTEAVVPVANDPIGADEVAASQLVALVQN